MSNHVLKPRRRLKIALTMLLAGLTIATGGVILTPEMAQAAPQHAGGNWNSYSGGWMGNYTASNGTRVYCIDNLIDGPAAGGGSGSLVTSTGTGPDGDSRNVTGAELRRLNYAITVWGQTSDPITAAAVNAYVWTYTAVNGQSAPPSNGIQEANGLRYINRYIAEASAIQTRYWQIRNDTNANYNNSAVGVGTGSLFFTVDATNNYLGTMTVVGLTPASAVGTVTLTNGVFVDTGLNIRDNVRAGDVIAVQGIPPEGVTEYKISGIGAFTAGSGHVYSSNLRVYSDMAQRGAGPGSRTANTVSFEISGDDPTPRDTAFNPIVGTQVAARFVDVGETFRDTLTFSTAADSEGLNNPWFQAEDGRYAPITATGTLYGPFLSEPVEADTAPAGAPVAASGITVTTTTADGPTIDYTADSGVTSSEPGFYTWVWEISAADQVASVRDNLLIEDYYFIDRFGQVVETHVTPSRAAITTQVVQTGTVGMGQPITDSVTVAAYGGGWLEQGDEPIPVTLTGTAYYSAVLPVSSPTAPGSAEVLGTTTLIFDGADTLVSDPILAPAKPGWVTWQWCLVEADQPVALQGYFVETCDAYGQGSETIEIAEVDLYSAALPAATRLDTITDTAYVNGALGEGFSVRFHLYEKPVEGQPKRDADGVATSDLWTAAEIDSQAGAAFCGVGSYYLTTSSVPVTAGVNDHAPYVSPGVQVPSNGTWWWIEELRFTDPVTSTVTTIAEGECGLPNETTLIDDPQVVTQAQSSIVVGESASDVATVTGLVPAEVTGIVTELTFEVFKETGTTAVCTDSNRFAAVTTPKVVTAAGDYTSAPVKFTEEGTYWWVETLTYVHPDGTREVAHVGECGLPNETTRVLPTMPNTGDSASFASLFGATGALLTAAGVVMILARRLRR